METNEIWYVQVLKVDFRRKSLIAIGSNDRLKLRKFIHLIKDHTAGRSNHSMSGFGLTSAIDVVAER